MRKVRHKNVVQFIGACTRKPNLCIVVEYMPGGSVYDYMRKVPSPTLLYIFPSRRSHNTLPISFHTSSGIVLKFQFPVKTSHTAKW